MSVILYQQPAMRRRILAGDVPRWLRRHPRASYIIGCMIATPDWVDRNEMRALRDMARQMSSITNVPHVLDHIVPINHPYVCGLNVPWNLCVLTRKQNAAKSNKFFPEQLELFT